MAVFPSDSIRTKNWGSEILTDSDLETQLDLLHSYLQACLNATTGHAHTGASNQGPKISPANLLIASQAQGDVLYASSSTAWARLGIGTAGQALVVNAGETAPEWADTVSSFASVAEVKTGTESAKAVAPSTMIGHDGVCKGWIDLNGTGTIAINDSYNVSGITDNGTGNYTITWDTDFASANYAVVATHLDDNGTTPTYGQIAYYNKLAGSVEIKCGDNSGSFQDTASLSVIAIGDR